MEDDIGTVPMLAVAETADMVAFFSLEKKYGDKLWFKLITYGVAGYRFYLSYNNVRLAHKHFEAYKKGLIGIIP